MVGETLRRLDGQAEDADDAVHGLVFPPHSAAPISLIIPVARAGRMETGTILLHDHAGHDVLEWLGQLGELVEALLHHGRRPLVHLVVLVRIAADGTLNSLFDDVRHLVNNKGCLLSRLKIIHFQLILDSKHRERCVECFPDP